MPMIRQDGGAGSTKGNLATRMRCHMKPNKYIHGLYFLSYVIGWRLLRFNLPLIVIVIVALIAVRLNDPVSGPGGSVPSTQSESPESDAQRAYQQLLRIASVTLNHWAFWPAFFLLAIVMARVAGQSLYFLPLAAIPRAILLGALAVVGAVLLRVFIPRLAALPAFAILLVPALQFAGKWIVEHFAQSRDKGSSKLTYHECRQDLRNLRENDGVGGLDLTIWAIPASGMPDADRAMWAQIVADAKQLDTAIRTKYGGVNPALRRVLRELSYPRADAVSNVEGKAFDDVLIPYIQLREVFCDA